jgi:hypothetical protein
MLYKLTNENMQTYNGFQWRVGDLVTTPGTGPLCSPGWIHCYTHPLLAVVLNPIHAGFKSPRLWTFNDRGAKRLHDHGLKVGVSRGKLVEEIPLPTVPIECRVRWAIQLALPVCEEADWCHWAEEWLSGRDRSSEAAWAAAREAAWTAAWTAAWAAREAKEAREAREAAWEAAWAAARAAETKPLPLAELLEQAICDEETTD